MVSGSVAAGVAEVGVAGVSAVSGLSVSAGSLFCDFRRPPRRPPEPLLPPPPPRDGLDFVVVVVAVIIEADIVQDVKLRLRASGSGGPWRLFRYTRRRDRAVPKLIKVIHW